MTPRTAKAEPSRSLGPSHSLPAFPRFLAALLALALLAACGAEDATPTPPDSGIQGQALAGPQCPVVQAGSPCPDEPLAATIDIVKADGSEKMTFDTDEDGYFRVPLEPGDYRIEPRPIDPGSPFPAPIPQDVTVPPHEWVEVTVRYDTGIR